MRSTAQQFKTLQKHFPQLNVSSIPKGNGYLVPKWQTLSDDYVAALETVLSHLAATRPFYNYCSSNMPGFRETKEKAAAMKGLPELVLLDAQLGTKYKGRSVNDTRSAFALGEFGLGAYEVACILLTHPEFLKSSEDLWIDCPGDEFKPSDESEFSLAPYFSFRGGELEFVRGWIDDAYGHCGSASAVLPQLNLAPGTLVSSDSLSLEARILKMEKWFEAHGFELS